MQPVQWRAIFSNNSCKNWLPKMYHLNIFVKYIFQKNTRQKQSPDRAFRQLWNQRRQMPKLLKSMKFVLCILCCCVFLYFSCLFNCVLKASKFTAMQTFQTKYFTSCPCILLSLCIVWCIYVQMSKSSLALNGGAYFSDVSGWKSIPIRCYRLHGFCLTITFCF